MNNIRGNTQEEKDESCSTATAGETNFKSQSFQCTICDYKSHIAFHLRRHMTATHKISNANIFKCDCCGELFDSSRNLKIHQESCNDKSLVKKKRRIKKETLPKSNSKMASQNETEKPNSYQSGEILPIPPFSDVKVKVLNENDSETIGSGVVKMENDESEGGLSVNTAELVASNIFVCGKCAEVFQESSEYKKHGKVCPCAVRTRRRMSEQEMEGRSDDSIPIPQSPENERRKRRGPIPRNSKYSVRCSICHKSFTSKATLWSHMKCIHENPSSFQCNICQKTFNHKSNMYQHILALHTTVRPYECPRCDYRALRKIDLEGHERRCNTPNSKCRSKTKTNGTLSNNEFNCPICNDVFSDTSTLVEHILDHGPDNGLNDSAENDKKESTQPSGRRKQRRSSNNKVKRRKVETGKDYENCDGAEREKDKAEVDNEQEDMGYDENPDLFDLDDQCNGSKYISPVSVFHQCEFCEEKFEHEDFLQTHVKELHSSDNGAEPFDNSVEMRAALARALAVLYPETKADDDFDKFRCKLCSITCLSEVALEGHMKRHF